MAFRSFTQNPTPATSYVGTILPKYLPPVTQSLDAYYYPSTISEIGPSDAAGQVIAVVCEPDPTRPADFFDLNLPTVGARGLPTAASADPKAFDTTHSFFFDVANQSVKRYNPTNGSWEIGFIRVSNSAGSLDVKINDRIIVESNEYPNFFSGHAGLIVVGRFDGVQRGGAGVKVAVSNIFFWDSVADTVNAMTTTAGATGTNGEIYCVAACPTTGAYSAAKYVCAIGGAFTGYNTTVSPANPFNNFCLFDCTLGAVDYVPFISAGDGLGNLASLQVPISMKYSYPSTNLCIGGTFVSQKVGGVTAACNPLIIMRLTATGPNVWTTSPIGNGSNFLSGSIINSVYCDDAGVFGPNDYTRFYAAGNFGIPYGGVSPQVLINYLNLVNDSSKPSIQPMANPSQLLYTDLKPALGWGVNVSNPAPTSNPVSPANTDSDYDIFIPYKCFISEITISCFQLSSYNSTGFNLVVSVASTPIAKSLNQGQASNDPSPWQVMSFAGFPVDAGTTIRVSLPYGAGFTYSSTDGTNANAVVITKAAAFPGEPKTITSFTPFFYSDNKLFSGAQFKVDNPNSIGTIIVENIGGTASSTIDTNVPIANYTSSVRVVLYNMATQIPFATTSPVSLAVGASLSNTTFTFTTNPTLDPNSAYFVAVEWTIANCADLWNASMITNKGPIYSQNYGILDPQDPLTLFLNYSLSTPGAAPQYVYNQCMFLDAVAGNERQAPIALPQLQGCPRTSRQLSVLSYAQPAGNIPNELIVLTAGNDSTGNTQGFGQMIIDISGNYGSYTYASPNDTSIVCQTLRSALTSRAYFGKSHVTASGFADVYLIEGEGDTVKAYRYSTEGLPGPLSCSADAYIYVVKPGVTAPTIVRSVNFISQYSSILLIGSKNSPGDWELLSQQGNVSFNN